MVIHKQRILAPQGLVDGSELKTVSLFDSIPNETIERVLASVKPIRYEAGQVIFLEGELAEHVFVLRQGWVKSTRMTRDGREQAMMFLKPTQIFGDVAVFLDANYPATATALESVELWRIPGKKYIEFICAYPELYMAVVKKLSRRVLHYMSLVEDLALRTVEARVANFLMSEATARAGELLVPRSSWQTYDQMASRLGTVRDVLNRTLRAFVDDGLIHVTRQAILLRDPERLSEKAQR